MFHLPTIRGTDNKMCPHLSLLNVLLVDFVCVKGGPLVRLISQDYKGHVDFVRRRDKVLLPLFEVLIALRVGHVIHQNAAIDTSVESAAQRLKSFLPSRIPHLEVDARPSGQGHTHVVKVSTNGWFRGQVHLLVNKTVHDSCFADTLITYEDDFGCGSAGLIEVSRGGEAGSG